MQFDMGSQVSRLLTTPEGEFAFSHRLIKFYLRTPRPGRFLLAGSVTDASGLPLTNELRVSTYFGFEKTYRLDGGTLSLAIPTAGGNCAISLALLNAMPGTN